MLIGFQDLGGKVFISSIYTLPESVPIFESFRTKKEQKIHDFINKMQNVFGQYTITTLINIIKMLIW